MVVEVKTEAVPAPDPRWVAYYALASRKRRARGWHRMRDDRLRRRPWGMPKKVLLLICVLGVMGVVAAMLIP
jgi:hypothetical protein